MTRPRFEVIRATAPSAWASYLINGDASGLEDDEIAQADSFVEFVNAGAPVSCEDADFIPCCNARDWGIIGYAADCQTYEFLQVKAYGDPDAAE